MKHETYNLELNFDRLPGKAAAAAYLRRFSRTHCITSSIDYDMQPLAVANLHIFDS